MPIVSHARSAEIIPFPGRFRSRIASLETVKPADKSMKIYDAAYASSWYHEAAVEDAQQGPKS